MSRILIVLLSLALCGCASDPEPAPEPPKPKVRDEIPPIDNPPLSKPRPKLIPGDVVDDAEREDDEE